MDLNRIYAWPLSLRLLLITGIAVLVFLLLYFFDISSLNTQLSQAQQHEQELKDQLVTTVNTQANKKNQLLQFQQVESQLISWQNKLTTYDYLPQLMDQILKTGTANHVEFKLFSPAPPVNDKGSLYFKVPIKIVALGTYDDLALFMSQIASFSTLPVVGDFSITNEIKPEFLDTAAKIQGVSDRLLMLDMTLEVYYLANQKTKK